MKKLPIIYLETKVHRKEKQLLLKFDYHNQLVVLIKSVKDTYWSKSLKAWYLNYSEENLNSILSLFKDLTEIDTSKIDKKVLFKRNLTNSQKKLLNNFYVYFNI